jgi:polyisoprenoid-binding protein YceI
MELIDWITREIDMLLIKPAARIMSARYMRISAVVLLLAAGAASGALAAAVPAGGTSGALAAAVPAGAYTLDPAHASLLFRVNHLGFSMYTARFKRFQATLRFDPANLTTSRLDVTVDAASLETDFPDPLKVDFNAQLRGPEWLNVEKHPKMTFRSTRVALTGKPGKRTFQTEGELTLLGVTKPVTLDAEYNGGYAGHPMDPNARVGFSARGHFKRSDFGLAIGIPAPGTTMGVGDDVEVIIEAEFTGPPLAAGPTTGH